MIGRLVTLQGSFVLSMTLQTTPRKRGADVNPIQTFFFGLTQLDCALAFIVIKKRSKALGSDESGPWGTLSVAPWSEAGRAKRPELFRPRPASVGVYVGPDSNLAQSITQPSPPFPAPFVSLPSVRLHIVGSGSGESGWGRWSAMARRGNYTVHIYVFETSSRCDDF